MCTFNRYLYSIERSLAYLDKELKYIQLFSIAFQITTDHKNLLYKRIKNLPSTISNILPVLCQLAASYYIPPYTCTKYTQNY